MTDFSARLRAAGMSPTQSAAKHSLFESALRDLRKLRGKAIETCCTFYVPGRVEVVGKHTDYAGGRSIVCAIERGICLVATPRADAQIHMVDSGRQADTHFTLGDEQAPNCDNWSKFPFTVASRMARDFPSVKLGADIAFSSDLPRAAGMSSSSALTVAVFFALAEINALWETSAYRKVIQSEEDLAGYLAAIESGESFAGSSGGPGVGTLGGSEDHVAILCSRAGFLRQYAFRPIRLEKEIGMPEGHTMVIGVSGVKADKTGNARESYNRVSLTARKILELWRSATRRKDASLSAAVSSESGAADRLKRILGESHAAEYPSELLLNRLEQFLQESNEIVPGVGEALARGEVEGVGTLADRSQALAEKLLGNQVPETSELARSARKFGAAAASAFGAGFGGSVWALVSVARAEGFREAWEANYRRRFPERAESSHFFFSRAGPGLIRL